MIPNSVAFLKAIMLFPTKILPVQILILHTKNTETCLSKHTTMQICNEISTYGEMPFQQMSIVMKYSDKQNYFPESNKVTIHFTLTNITAKIYQFNATEI